MERKKASTTKDTTEEEDDAFLDMSDEEYERELAQLTAEDPQFAAAIAELDAEMAEEKAQFLQELSEHVEAYERAHAKQYIRKRPSRGAMAHTVKIKLTKAIEIENSDVEIVVSAGARGGARTRLGTLLVSRGNIEWLPVKHSVNKHRLTWKQFAAYMEGRGVKRKAPK